MAILSEDFRILNAFDFYKEHLVNRNALSICIGNIRDWSVENVDSESVFYNTDISDINPPKATTPSTFTANDVIAIKSSPRIELVYKVDVGASVLSNTSEFVVYANQMYKVINFNVVDANPLSPSFSLYDFMDEYRALIPEDEQVIFAPHYVYLECFFPYSALYNVLEYFDGISDHYPYDDADESCVSKASNLVYRSAALLRDTVFSDDIPYSDSEGIVKGGCSSSDSTGDIVNLGRVLCLDYFRPIYRDKSKIEKISYLFEF